MHVHAVATGYLLGVHDDLWNLLPVVCQRITIKGKEYALRDDAAWIEPVSKYFEENDIVNICDLTKDPDVVLTLWPDVVIAGNGDCFLVKQWPNIKIGQPHICCNMIYILCVGYDFDDDNDASCVDDKTLRHLMEWKNILVRCNRINANVKFGSVANCCS